MTYSELVQLIKDYLENSGTTFSTNIDTFIKQAEERIYYDVDIHPLRKTATGTLTASTATLSVPSDFLGAISFRITNGSSEYVYLLPKQEDFLSEAYPDADTGTPIYYAISDDTNFILAPTPDSAYVYQLKYRYDPESIVTATTTWLGDNAESALLYGALVEAYHFEKGDVEQMNNYERRYQEALQSLAKFGNVDLRRDDYRNGQNRR